MSGWKAYQLIFRRDLTTAQQVERNLSIAAFNLKIFIGCQVILTALAIWKLLK